MASNNTTSFKNTTLSGGNKFSNFKIISIEMYVSNSLRDSFILTIDALKNLNSMTRFGALSSADGHGANFYYVNDTTIALVVSDTYTTVWVNGFK